MLDITRGIPQCHRRYRDFRTPVRRRRYLCSEYIFGPRLFFPNLRKDPDPCQDAYPYGKRLENHSHLQNQNVRIVPKKPKKNRIKQHVNHHTFGENMAFQDRGKLSSVHWTTVGCPITMHLHMAIHTLPAIRRISFTARSQAKTFHSLVGSRSQNGVVVARCHEDVGDEPRGKAFLA